MIYLINPPSINFHARSSRWGGMKNRSGILAPPLYLAQAASFLNSKGKPARIIDMCTLGYGKKQLDDFIKKLNNFDLLVFEVSTSSIDTDSKVAEYIKNKKNIKIVFVGAHVSVLPEETLKKYSVDYVCIGEYEETLCGLYNALDNKVSFKEVKGLAFFDGGNFIRNQARPLMDLNNLPFVCYEDLPVEKYYDPIARNKRYMPVLSSRGCSYKCAFCVEPQIMFNQKVRFKKPEYVVDEIEYLVKNFSIKEIFFDDSTFTLNKKHVFSICSQIKKRNLNIDWSCFARADCIDKSLLLEMKSAGCYMIRLGAESLDDAVLKNMNKSLTSRDIKNAVALIKKLGIKLHLTVMFGYPKETLDTINKTLNFILHSKADYVQFSIATPYPGTEFFKKMKYESRLLTLNWAEYDGTCNYVLKSDEFMPGQLSGILNKAYRKFYLNPVYILKKIKNIKRTDELYYLFKSGKTLIKSQF